MAQKIMPTSSQKLSTEFSMYVICFSNLNQHMYICVNTLHSASSGTVLFSTPTPSSVKGMVLIKTCVFITCTCDYELVCCMYVVVVIVLLLV